MKKKPHTPHCEDCEIRPSSIFCQLEQQFLDQASIKKTCNIFTKGDYIFHEDNHPLGLYCIYEGKAKIFKTNDEGKEQILRLTKAGDVVGYRSLISGESYKASAVALEECSICFLPQELFKQFLKESKNLFLELAGLLAKDLKNAESQLADIAQKSVRERVADTLLMLSTFYGFEEDNATINISLSREDLASIVGTANETLIRMLSEFKKESLIVLKKKKITLLDIPKIKSIAQLYD